MNFQLRVHWHNEKKTGYPAILTLVTDTMMENYQRYGELLTLTLFDGLIKEDTNRNFQVAFFSVLDGNMRPLLAGVSLFDDAVISPIYKSFRSLLDIQGKKPRSIVSNDYPTIVKGIKELCEGRIFDGGFLLHPLSVITEITRKLEGKPN